MPAFRAHHAHLSIAMAGPIPAFRAHPAHLSIAMAGPIPAIRAHHAHPSIAMAGRVPAIHALNAGPRMIVPNPAMVHGTRALPIGGLVQLLASVVLLSSAWPLTKIALAAGSTPIWFAEGRAVLSGLTACLLLAVTRGLRLPTRPDLPAMFAIGGLQLGAYFALAHEAVAWVPAGRTAILANTTTIWVVPLSLIFLREHIPARRWLAVALGLIGVAVLINPMAIDWSSTPIMIGHVFLLGAGLSWSIAIIVTRAARPHLSMFALLPWCFLIGSLILVPLLAWHAPNGTLGTSPASWWALAYIGLIAGPLGTWCVMEATAKLPTLVSSVGFLTTPAVSLILANVFLHEPFTPDLLAGSALIMAGVAFTAWPTRRIAEPPHPMTTQRTP